MNNSLDQVANSLQHAEWFNYDAIEADDTEVMEGSLLLQAILQIPYETN